MTECGACGAARDPGTRFCRRCGARFDAEEAAQGTGTDPQPPTGFDGAPVGRGAAWYAALAGGIAVVVAAAVLAGITWLGGGIEAGGSSGRVPVTEPTVEEPSAAPTTTTQAPSVPPSTSAPPVAGNDVVAVSAQAAGHPAVHVVVDVLTAYFVSINDRDFTTYRSLFTQEIQAQLNLEQVAEGYRSTYDSGAQLLEIEDLADGRVAAWVEFVSTQDAAEGPDGQTCTVWSIGLFLQWEGSRAAIGAPPEGYQASYYPC
jgi:hypothetical protein